LEAAHGIAISHYGKTVIRDVTSTAVLSLPGYFGALLVLTSSLIHEALSRLKSSRPQHQQIALQ
jgi:hypothetical protein